MFVDTLSKLTGDLTLVPKKISQLLFKSLSTITQLNTRHGNNTEIFAPEWNMKLEITRNINMQALYLTSSKDSKLMVHH